NEGTDTIKSSETITLSKYTTVETLELTGNKAIKGTGNANNNLIEGNDGNNILSGKEGNDTLNGGAGNDTLIGDAGDDVLDGGDDEDTVRYDESQDSYAIKQIDGRFSVINKTTGETDELVDIEFVAFSDTTEQLGISKSALHLSMADVSIQEGNKANSTNAKVVLTLDNPATETFTVDLNTEDGTALVGKDYKAVQKTITFNEGDKSATVQIPIISDKVFELDENFTVHIDNVSLDSIELNNTDATIMILNDDKPSLSFAAVKITEGQKGKVNADVSVTFSNVISQAIKVHYQTVDGTALKAKDYLATTGDLIIPANTKTAKISIPIIDDKISESIENFMVKFSNPENALLPSNASVTITISDNDVPISLTGVVA
ncbi:MAG: Calx-beta domain-containing protein, partial [Methylococcales bacterium]|nr:Calx-beta domain-containing protein [Methylococcales bacterium]